MFSIRTWSYKINNFNISFPLSTRYSKDTVHQQLRTFVSPLILRFTYFWNKVCWRCCSNSTALHLENYFQPTAKSIIWGPFSGWQVHNFQSISDFDILINLVFYNIAVAVLPKLFFFFPSNEKNLSSP